jgi:hypothetical protein
MMNMRLGFIVVGIVLLVGAVGGQVRSERDTVVAQGASADEKIRADWAEKWRTDLEENAPAWSAWREDVRSALKANENYTTAVQAVEDYPNDRSVFFAKDAYDALVATREAVYRNIALAVYEDHFGPWEGDLAEFDVLLAAAKESKLEECSRVAKDTCGTSGIKSLKVSEDSCEFTCKDTQ